jgi:hypothetical protein
MHGVSVKEVTSTVQQSTRKSTRRASPKQELGINRESEESWKGFLPSIMSEGDRLCTPETGKKRMGLYLPSLTSSIAILPPPRSYHGQIQETDACIKKVSLGSVWLFIQFSPCHPDLGYVHQSPNKLEWINSSLGKSSR